MMRALLALPIGLTMMTLPASAQEEAMDEWLDEVSSDLVHCQDKSMSVPTANDTIYASVRTRRICVPASFGPAHEEGIEADCLVRFRLNGDGEPSIESSTCNTGIHGDFDQPERVALKLNLAKLLYEATSSRAAAGWRYDISSDLEAENFGVIQLPFEYLVKEEGPHTFDPVQPDAMKVGPGYYADELVDEPEAEAAEDAS